VLVTGNLFFLQEEGHGAEAQALFDPGVKDIHEFILAF
jgi:hypothetical protein